MKIVESHSHAGFGAPWRAAALGCLFLLGLIAPAFAQTPPPQPPTGLAPEEQQLFDFMRNHSGQQRPFLAVDPILTMVARQKCKDMAMRGYVSHTIPPGGPNTNGPGFGAKHQGESGPNFEVRKAGFKLPTSYADVDTNPSSKYYGEPENYIESLAAGRPNATITWSDFMKSEPHRDHLLARFTYFQQQTSVGIGHYYKENDPEHYYHYWVIITAPSPFESFDWTEWNTPEPAPLLGEGQRLTDSDFDPSSGEYEFWGIAASAGVERVRYRLQTAEGFGPWTEAETDFFPPSPDPANQTTNYNSGDRYWYGAFQKNQLTPGRNLLHVEGTDFSGLIVKDQFVRSFTFVQLRQLLVTVHPAATGTLSPDLAGPSQQEVGKTITITAKPKTGFIFKSWNGLSTSTSPTLNFQITEATSLVANFVPHPFLLRKGTYNGMLSNGRGTIRITPGASGSFSGSVTYVQPGLQKTYSFKGAFNPQTGVAPLITIKRTGLPPLTLNLQMDVDGFSGFTGTMVDGAQLTNFFGMANYNRTLTQVDYPGLGRYTVLLPSTSASAPPAPGWATLTISKTGAATLRGALPDGVTFSHSTVVDVNGEVPLFVNLYGGKGSLQGVYHVPTNTNDLSVDGNVHWSKPQLATPVVPNPVEADFNLMGSFYQKPANTTVLGPDFALNTDVDVVVGGGNLANALTVEAVLTSLNALQLVDPLNPPLPKFKVSINAATGQFTGSFQHPVSLKVRTFKGVFLQAQNRGAGAFSDVSFLQQQPIGKVGSVEVNPTP